jgi:hypothetical protein
MQQIQEDMMNSSDNHPKEIFEAEQNEYNQAKTKYLTAIKALKPLSILEELASPPTNRAAYSDRMAWTMAYMAKLAYIRFEEDELELERLEYSLQSGWFNLIKTFNRNGTQAFMAKNNEFAVLAFRGTQLDRWEDIRTDIQILKQKTVKGRVHTGFIEAFKDVREEIFDAVRNSTGTELPLYVTGHSLGAALATVATGELDDTFHDLIAACYTFGSPRVGDGKYEKSIKTPFYRVLNVTDVVTLLPFLFGTFVHVGDARYLSRRRVNDVYLIYRGVPSLRRFFEAMVDMLAALLRLSNPLSPWINGHNIDLYVDKLERYARSRNPTN